MSTSNYDHKDSGSDFLDSPENKLRKAFLEDNEQIQQLKKELKNERQKYSELEKQNRLLTEQVQAKDSKFSEVLSKIKKLEALNEDYSVQLSNWEKKYNSMMKMYDNKINELQHENENLRNFSPVCFNYFILFYFLKIRFKVCNGSIIYPSLT